jgi:single-strand DNA-binding protein
MNLNRVILTGNLTADPELRSTAAGTSVCDLRIACNTRRKDSASGEWVDKPNYFNVVVWAAQADNAARFLTKGRPVAIDGRLEWREWETQDGSKRQTVEIIADTVQYLGSARALDTTGEEPTPERRAAEIPTPAAAPPATEPQDAEKAQEAPAAA